MDYPKNKPFFMYQVPMFMVTVSVVAIYEDEVILLPCGGEKHKCPGGIVKAGQETVQFSAVRHLKEQADVIVKKENLIPVDFRSDPERSEEKNEIDIGFVCTIDNAPNANICLAKINFENKKLVSKYNLFSDHAILIERAIDIYLMIKE